MTVVTRAALALLVAVIVIVFAGACNDSGGEDGTDRDRSGPGAAADEPRGEAGSGRAGDAIVIGARGVPQQTLLAEIYTQALRSAGLEARRRIEPLGPPKSAFRALRRNVVDAYPEYTTTALTRVLGTAFEDVPRKAESAFQQVERVMARERVIALPIPVLRSTYRLAVLVQRLDGLGVTKTSELRGKAGSLTIAGSPGCEQSADCLAGLEREYGLDFGGFVASERPLELLREQQADLGIVLTTDGGFSTDRYATLDDDQGFFPPYNVTLLARDGVVEKLGQEGRRAIERAQAALTGKVMIRLNARVVLAGKKPRDVAAAFLEAHGISGMN